MSKTPIVDAEILKTKAELRNYPEFDRIFEQYQSMRDLARDLEEKLAAEKAKHAWQPIETAPKDATRVILWDGYIRLAAWRTTTNSGDRTAPCWVETDCEDCFYNEYVEAPTHWMPLPPRPPS